MRDQMLVILTGRRRPVLLDGPTARHLIRRGEATAYAPAPTEAATATPPETAALPRPRGRRR